MFDFGYFDNNIDNSEMLLLPLNESIDSCEEMSYKIQPTVNDLSDEVNNIISSLSKCTASTNGRFIR